jgi:hypothetical protein
MLEKCHVERVTVRLNLAEPRHQEAEPPIFLYQKTCSYPNTTPIFHVLSKNTQQPMIYTPPLPYIPEVRTRRSQFVSLLALRILLLDHMLTRPAIAHRTSSAIGRRSSGCGSARWLSSTSALALAGCGGRLEQGCERCDWTAICRNIR